MDITGQSRVLTHESIKNYHGTYQRKREISTKDKTSTKTIHVPYTQIYTQRTSQKLNFNCNRIRSMHERRNIFGGYVPSISVQYLWKFQGNLPNSFLPRPGFLWWMASGCCLFSFAFALKWNWSFYVTSEQKLRLWTGISVSFFEQG